MTPQQTTDAKLAAVRAKQGIILYNFAIIVIGL
jgi:hypothetical protein